MMNGTSDRATGALRGAASAGADMAFAGRHGSNVRPVNLGHAAVTGTRFDWPGFTGIGVLGGTTGGTSRRPRGLGPGPRSGGTVPKRRPSGDDAEARWENEGGRSTPAPPSEPARARPLPLVPRRALPFLGKRIRNSRTATSAEVAAALLKHTPEILRRWDERVRAAVPASRDQGHLVLKNNLGPLLGEVARALSPTGISPTTIAGLTLSEDHGDHRAALPAYRIDGVFLEYRLRRRAILEVLDEALCVTGEHREVINDALERATQEAVSQFSQAVHAAERSMGDAARRRETAMHAAYERERRITEVLQRPLLAQVAEDAVAGLSLATFYEPARTDAEVGGDFFDVVPLAGGRVALVVGDTCGKGLEAAVHNTQVKDVLRAFLRESPGRPGAILTRLNQVVCDVLARQDPELQQRFVVVSLLILDPGTGESFYSSAGAEALLVVRRTGDTEVVTRPNLPLGIQRDVAYEDTPVELEPGDTTVQVTDGITEARHGAELLGYQRMTELVKDALQAPTLSEAGDRVFEGAHNFARGDLSDDVCLILARRR